jgi:hypothetical protein
MFMHIVPEMRGLCQKKNKKRGSGFRKNTRNRLQAPLFDSTATEVFAKKGIAHLELGRERMFAKCFFPETGRVFSQGVQTPLKFCTPAFQAIAVDGKPFTSTV